MRRFLALLVALTIGWLALPSAASASLIEHGRRLTYTYDLPGHVEPDKDDVRGGDPPHVRFVNTTYDAATRSLCGSSARSARTATPIVYTYDTLAPLAQAAPDAGTTHKQVQDERAALSVLGDSGVATKGAIGFSDDAVGSAYQGMRSGGGHAIRHLRDEGLISNSGSLASQVSQFENLTSPILRSPSSTFDWRLGNTLTRGFAGESRGRQVVVFVAKEGPYQGRVLSAVVPDASQMAQWGLP